MNSVHGRPPLRDILQSFDDSSVEDVKRILWELPFTLQGVSSADIQVSSQAVTLPPLPLTTLSLLQVFGEAGLLHHKLEVFCNASWGGLVTQAVREEVRKELANYARLVADIEVDVRTKSDTSLMSCAVRVEESLRTLRFLLYIMDRMAEKNGGQIASILWEYTRHGDPHVQAQAKSLLRAATMPLYELIADWVFSGKLDDPFGDFWVRLRDADGDWSQKYAVDESCVPAFVSAEVQAKVTAIGKSLEFLSHSCGDQEWVTQHAATMSGPLSYEGALEVVYELYESTSAHLLHVLTTKFELQLHLRALKQYLLLGAGDFIQFLLESLAESLDRPAATIYRHQLTSSLDAAIRSSNAQFMAASVLRRLDARMLEASPESSALGWDIFTLEYKISPPLDVIVDAHAARQYLKIFNFLWRIKRVGFVLARAWKRSHTGARGVLAKVADAVGQEWRTTRLALHQMNHFVCQLQYYILFEVIESAWHTLQNQLSLHKGLDHAIAAHKQYLLDITNKGLLGSGGRNEQAEETLLVQLHEILKLMTTYAEKVETLYGISTAELARRQGQEREVERRTAQGKWGMDDDMTPAPSTLDEIVPLGTNMRDLYSSFVSRVSSLLGDLAYQSDLEMRFLGVRLNFNEYYGLARRKRR